LTHKKTVLLVLLVFLIMGVSSCKYNWSGLLSKDTQMEDLLFPVQIVFTDEASLKGYVKSLGVHKEGQVYVGGASLNYLYDKNGNIVGSYNYQRVLYIKIIKDEELQSPQVET